MSWAASRRTIILTVIGVFAALVAAGVLISAVYQTPSCADGKKNQDETGVDCGGSCALLCADSQVPPVVSFVRELPQTSGRVDVIAYVQNPNPFAAAKDARYEIEFLGENGTSLGTKTGKVDLPPAAEVPVFIAGALPAGTFVRQAFMSFDESSISWFAPGEDELEPFVVEEVQVGGTEDAPRVSASVRNPSVDSFRNVVVIATLFDEDGNAFAASQTVIAELRGRGEAGVTFTWNAPWRQAPARIDVRPVRDL